MFCGRRFALCLIAGVLAISVSGRTLWANTELSGAGVANTNGAVAAGTGATAVGDGANASGHSAVALGIGSQAAGVESLALGNEAKSPWWRSIAIGSGASVAGEEAMAIGGYAASDRYGVAVGGQARALGSVGVAIGKSSFSDGSWCVAIGYNATAKGESAVAIGDHAGYETDGKSNTALGDSSGRFVTGDNNIASGRDAGSGVTGDNNIASGEYAGNMVTGDDNIASGSGAGTLVNGSRNVAMGTYAGQGDFSVWPFTPLAVNDTVAIGTGARAGADSAVAIGLGAEAAGERSIAIGTGNVVTGARSGAIGDPNTITGNDSYALGNNNTIQADGAFVVGSGVTVPAGLHGSVVLGNASAAAAPEPAPSAVIGGVQYNFAGGNPASVVSVGAPGAERQITNVAAGRLSPVSTDAVNGSQLYATNQAVDNLAMGVKGDIAEAGALSAALAGLHSMQYDPVTPSQFMLGAGNYRGEWGVALGFAHYPNENFLLHAGVAFGGGDHVMTNFGATWKIGESKRRGEIPEQYRKGPISSIYVMQRENAQLQSQVQMLTAENAKIKAQLAEIMRKLGME